jgi:hypothetical protein
MEISRRHYFRNGLRIFLISSGSKKKELRRACLREFRASHAHKMWTEVSSLAPHFLQVRLLLNAITYRCFLRVLCPVTRPVTTLDYVLLKDRCQILANKSRIIHHLPSESFENKPQVNSNFRIYENSIINYRTLSILCMPPILHSVGNKILGTHQPLKLYQVTCIKTVRLIWGFHSLSYIKGASDSGHDKHNIFKESATITWLIALC